MFPHDTWLSLCYFKNTYLISLHNFRTYNHFEKCIYIECYFKNFLIHNRSNHSKIVSNIHKLNYSQDKTLWKFNIKRVFLKWFDVRWRIKIKHNRMVYHLHVHNPTGFKLQSIFQFQCYEYNESLKKIFKYQRYDIDRCTSKYH